MKKKLVLLLIALGYTRGSFSEEPLSPFGPSSFAVHPQENQFGSAEFHPQEQPFRATESTPEQGFRTESEFHPSQERFGHNPYEQHQALPAREEESHGEREMHREEPRSFAPRQEERPQREYHPDFHPGMREGREEPTSPAEKDSDTGEELVIDHEVDTFGQEGSGNWVIKRAFWEKTEQIYEQIKQVFSEIMNARMDFISQRNRLDRELDVAYGQIGLEEGELQDSIEACLSFAKQEKKEDGFLNKEEEDFYNALQPRQHDLEQIKLDMKALQAVNQKIDEALDTLFKQIDVANQYEQKAWENFKDIARELNDKIARKSYYETEGLLKDIQNVHNYITGQFSSYFNQTLQLARNHSQTISSQVQSLKQAGVDLKKRAEALERAHEAERVKKEVGEQVKAEETKKHQEEKAKAEQGFFTRTVSSVQLFLLGLWEGVLNGVSSVLSTLKNWFGKEESAVHKREKALAQTIAEEENKSGTSIKKKQGEGHDQLHSEHHEQPLSEPQEVRREQRHAMPLQEVQNGNPFERMEQHERAAVAHPVQNPFEHRPASQDQRREREDSFRSHTEAPAARSVMPREPEHHAVRAFGFPPAEEEHRPLVSVEAPFKEQTEARRTQPQQPTSGGPRPLSPFVRQ